MRFVNREKEIKYLNDHFESDPNSLLFLYGPKSSGKSTLLSKVIEDLDKNIYTINYLNLREMLIYDFNSFLDSFFPKSLYNKIADIADGITFNIGFFGVSVEDEKILKQNAFKIMGDKLRAAKSKGKKPIIIIDEIQQLKNISINGERYLIEELFNLFVSLTKFSHTAHIVLATSDSYYIEVIYNNAKLSKSSTFYYIDNLTKNDVYLWLAEEGFSQKDIDVVWNYLGGNPWEIQQVINECAHNQDCKESCLRLVNDGYGKLYDFMLRMDKEEVDVMMNVIKEIVKSNMYRLSGIGDNQILMTAIRKMVSHDFWFYKTDEQKIIANSKSIWWAFERLVKIRGLF
jgi:AAA+ ATPase superfamily predicted ATPase